jgi:release factor glutamine methyltransferase
MEVQAAGKRRVLSFDFLDRQAMRLVKPFLQFYLKKDRKFVYGDLKLTIKKSVFHPGFFFSSLYFARFIETLPLAQKKVCDVGAGSGILSFTALRKKAFVTAIDINEDAVKGIRENLVRNFPGSKMPVIHSDLFKSVPSQQFDYVFINPPYFFRPVNGNESRAWNCGPNGEFFRDLFNSLPAFTSVTSSVYMCLAENCDIARITEIAQVAGFRLTQAHSEKIRWEINFIFRLERNGD